MAEFIRHSSVRQCYADALRAIEQKMAGASTDHQLLASPPPLRDLLAASSCCVAYQGWVAALSDFTARLSSTFDDFISLKHVLALGDAFRRITTPSLGLPAVQPQLGADVSMQGGDMSLALKIISINVRSMHDSGKVKFVFQRLRDLGADIAFIQETRLPSHFNFTNLDDYHIVTAPAVAGHGGLLIAVKHAEHVALSKYKVFSSRVLVAHFTIASKACKLVCMHAPIPEALTCEHEAFAHDVESALAHTCLGTLVFVGSDMNAKLAGLQDEFSCVGELAVSACPQRAAYRHSCLKAFSRHRLKAANTVLALPSHTTWRHPSGSERQIDFAWVPESIITSGRLLSCAVGSWGQFDCVTTSDHRHLEVVVLLQVTRVQRSSTDRRRKLRFVDEDHLNAYTMTMQQALQPWDENESPASYIQRALSVAKDTMTSTSPKRSPQRKPWIDTITWDAMHRLNLWRRLRTALRRDDAIHAQALLTRLEVLHLKIEHDNPCSLLAAVDAQLKDLRAKVRKDLRMCRRTWFHSACSNVEALRTENKSRQMHKAIKMVCSHTSHRGSRLMADDGTVISDKETVDVMWLQYWQEHFKAAQVPAADLQDRHTMTRPGCSTRNAEIESPWMFTTNEVATTLRGMPRWKATSDPIPAPAIISLSEKLAAPLCQYFNSCIGSACVPVAYAGACITPVWKKKGSEHLCPSFRPIALLTLESKLLAKLCLSKLGPMLSYHASQYGSGPKAGVLYLQLAVLQASSFSRASHMASATIFIDVFGAFDSVPLPMLWDEDDITTHPSKQAAFEQRGYSAPSAAAMAKYLQDHPCILAKVGVPLSVIDLLRSWGSNTWLVSNVNQTSALHPHTGVLQGQNLAGLLFDVFYSHLMQTAETKLTESGIGLVLPMVRDRSLQLHEDGQTCSVGCVAYRDDLAFPLASPTNAGLIDMIAKAVSILAAVHADYHLQLNFSRGKTETTINFLSPSSKGYMQGLRMIGRSAGLGAPAIPLDDERHILLAQEYNHLGRYHAQGGSLRKEISCRIAKANAAFKQYNRVLTSPQIATSARVVLFMTYVACHLLQNASSTPRLTDSEYHNLRRCYMQLLRRTLLEHSTSLRVSRLTDEEVCSRYNVANFLTLWDRRRLRALSKIVTVDSPPLMALLAVHMGKGSVWTGMFDSMSRLRSCTSEFGDLPIPSPVSFAAWCAAVIARHEEWSLAVKAYTVKDPPRKHVCSPMEDDNQRHPEAPLQHQPETTDGSQDIDGRTSRHVCPSCGFPSKSAAGLAMHSRRVHGVQTPLSLRLRSARCPACNMVCDNRHRALDHLKNSKRCGTYQTSASIT
eukprot:6461218-Amphidinium_carterae.2